jgi:hypothetical protein
MKKFLLFVVPILVLSCYQLVPTPNDFPPPPSEMPINEFPPITPIVEWPQVTATATLEPHLRPVVPDDMDEAETFFLIVKTSIAAGDDVGVAKMMKYPIHVSLAGQEMVINTETEFLDAYDQIFDPEFATALFEMDESELTLLPNGVQAGTGELWFNYYCVDLTCSDTQFFITQINR